MLRYIQNNVFEHADTERNKHEAINYEITS